jgi:uncharacterized protein (TIGR02118 family)
MPVKLIVMYPRPKDVQAFETVYKNQHVPLAVEKLAGKTKLVATRVLGSPNGKPPFHRIAEIHFPSMEALETCAASEGGKTDACECGFDFIRWRASLSRS